jgi:hypothetical protein
MRKKHFVEWEERVKRDFFLKSLLEEIRAPITG